MSTRNYGLINSVDELAERLESIHGNVFGLDIETGLDGPDIEKGAIHPETAKVVGISFTDSLDWARYVPLAHDTGENLDNTECAKLFWDLLQTGLVVAHNIVFELRHLARWFREHLWDDPERGEAVRISHGYFPIHSDSMVEAYLAAEYQRFGLKFLTNAMFGHQMTELHELFPDLPKNRRKFLRFNTLETTPQVVDYACEDSVWCLAIHRRYYDRLKDTLLYKVEKAIVQDVVPGMEDEGVVYDWAMMRRSADELRAFRDKWNAEIMADFTEHLGEPVAINLASPPQVRTILFDRMGLRTSVFTDKTRDLDPDKRVMSTGDIALQKLAKDWPVVKKVLQWREQTKLLGTYLDKYEAKFNYADDGRAHPNHLSAFVITGRFSVSDPPYQGSPKVYHFDLKVARDAHAAGEEPPAGTCFKLNFRDVIKAPDDWYILGFDLSQAELRAVAGLAQEQTLLDAFARGDDVHKLTASLMLGVLLADISKDQRDVGKTMNFALLFGLSTKGLADRLAIPIDEAQSLMDKYFAGMPSIAAFIQESIRKGKSQGYVTSKFGRRLPIWEYESTNPWIYSKGDRACVNYQVQGAATGDYMKIAMVRVVAAIKQAGLQDKIKLVMNIHDALEFYVHRSVSPQDAIDLIKPAVVYPVPGWPEMQADWHIAKRWGSPTELTFAEDGTLLVNDQPLERDPVTQIEQNEDGEAVEVLPEVNVDALRAAATDTSRTVLISLLEMPVPGPWSQFITLARDTLGSNEIRVRTPEGELTLPFPSGLDTSHLGRVAAILPGASMRYELHAAPSQLVDGLLL